MKNYFTHKYSLIICLSIITLPLAGQSTLEPDYFLIGRDQLPDGQFIRDTFMFFEAGKGAFRGGGLANNTFWNPDSIGYFSFAYGINVKASGNIGACAIGNMSSASGMSGATAIGHFTKALGNNGAIALGNNTTASGNYGTLAAGNNTIASGQSGAIALGLLSSASGNSGATALGYSSSASGNIGATALGYSSSASGDYGAMALGNHTSASGNSCIAIGMFNDSIVATGTSVIQDSPLFIIGNGVDNGNRSNALVVRKRGDMGLGTNNPEAWFHVRNTFLGDSSGIKITNAHTSGVFNSLIYNDTVGDLVLRKQIIPNQLVLGLNGRVGIGRKPSTNKLELEGEASKTTAGNWIGNSDRRLKKNISSIAPEQALQLLQQLHGVYFEWNDTLSGYSRPDGQQMGFIAQEIQEVFPEKVSQDTEGYYQTAYGDYDALFVQGFKALVQEISQVREENMDLKIQNQDLKDRLEQLETAVYHQLIMDPLTQNNLKN